MVPLGAVATVRETSGADKIVRYNMFPSADLNGAPAPGFSTGQALSTVERLATENLPTSFSTEWTELALQQKLAGNAALYIFPLCVLFVFLVLAELALMLMTNGFITGTVIDIDGGGLLS